MNWAGSFARTTQSAESRLYYQSFQIIERDEFVLILGNGFDPLTIIRVKITLKCIYGILAKAMVYMEVAELRIG
jgi:hypothetical protein